LNGTNVPERINGLSEAVFGRPVMSIYAQLGALCYQLLHAIAATAIEAKERNADQALFAVHYFPNSRRNMQDTFSDFSRFVHALAPGRISRQAAVSPSARRPRAAPSSSSKCSSSCATIGFRRPFRALDAGPRT
jgi:hypothetical protein